MSFRLEGKCALITGGASGIGRATALLLAQEGAAIAVMDVDETGGRAVEQEVLNTGGRVIFVRGDVTQSQDCRLAVQRCVERLGGLDILVNNAGIIRRSSVLETSEEEWDFVMAVNAKSVFLLSKHAIPVMIRSGGGAIVNISSGWGLVGGSRAAAYCASKGAVVQLTRAMALDHGVHNIRVNCICPGDTDTPMLRQEAQELGQAEDLFLADAADRPLQRIGTPQDIAQAVLYLVSEAAAFVTGAALVVDGGGLAG
jgi:NAD(P)-dependent dehydrogenase (short-subunit alcohol dehydrogenase family)